MKLTRQGYNSFSLEGLTLQDLKIIWGSSSITPKGDDIYQYLTNCNVRESNNPDDVNAIKTREE